MVNQARLVDVDPYGTGATGAMRWSCSPTPGRPDQPVVVRQPHRRSDRRPVVTQTGGHVIDIEPNNVDAGTFDVVLQGCPCARNWWAVGLDDAGLTSALQQTHGRITSLATYAAQGQRRFAVSLIDNT